MQLSKYISELLYRYDCVMVPNFGGFVSNTVSSKIDSETHQFTPPSKNISFNVNLQQNDGLLTNHIATSLHISYDKASDIIRKEVEAWKNDLKNAPLLLQNIGQLFLEEDHLVFEPISKVNYLTSSFGLSDVDANYILRQNTSISQETVLKKSYKKHVGIAAAIAALFVGGTTYVNHVQNQQDLVHQEQTNNKIQEASFNILKPLPSVTLTVEKEEEVKENKKGIYKYHIVAGAFKEVKNAKRKVAMLKAKGYDAKIIGVNKWGLTQVVYASFNDKRTAINALNKTKKLENKYAWLLVNE